MVEALGFRLVRVSGSPLKLIDRYSLGLEDAR